MITKWKLSSSGGGRSSYSNTIEEALESLIEYGGNGTLQKMTREGDNEIQYGRKFYIKPLTEKK